MESFKRGMHNILYILSCNDNTFIKIGICKDYNQIIKRIKTLQTGNPYKIELLHYEERPSAKDAEHYLHTCFSTNRVSGEWFKNITLTDVRRKLMMFHDQV